MADFTLTRAWQAVPDDVSDDALRALAPHIRVLEDANTGKRQARLANDTEVLADEAEKRAAEARKQADEARKRADEATRQARLLKNAGLGPRPQNAAEVPASTAIDFKAIPVAEGFEKLEEWAAEVARLAALPPHEYDHVRKSEASRLGVRVGTLDDDVKKARPKDAPDGGQGEAVVFEEPEPWPDPVNGAELLDDIAAFLGDHLALRQHDDTKAALWILHTHVYEAFFITPRLAVTSATKRCGKSTLLDVLNATCSRTVMADSLTVAATFRTVALAKPTLLIDEADTFLKDNEELRGILNSGHKATGSVIRAVEVQGEWVPKRFRTFSPCAIAMIGRLPGTLEDRSISIVMRRAMPGEVRRSFRPDRASAFEDLRRKMARFVADNAAALAAAEPEMPSGAFNRFADNWRPLLALADVAGGDWPKRARDTVRFDLGQAEDDELGTQLLEDVRVVFDQYVDADSRTMPAQKLASLIIVGGLKEMDDRPWNEMGRSGAPITQHKLGRMLKQFQINSHGSIRLASGKTSKGYRRIDFEEAWNRYLPPLVPNQTGTPAQAKETATSDRFQTGTNGPGVPVQKRRKAKETATCAGAPVPKGTSGAKREKPNGPEPGTGAGVPFMITRQMKADLKARGYSDAQIRTMTPQQAHAHLAGEAHGGGGEADHRKPNDVERPLESCAHCGGELERGDMLPLNSGGHVHHRCADDYIRARDTARPRVDPELQALCKRALQAKGARAERALLAPRGLPLRRSRTAAGAGAARRARGAARVTDHTPGGGSDDRRQFLPIAARWRSPASARGAHRPRSPSCAASLR